MAEIETAGVPEIDVDAMTDEEFASFKSGMIENADNEPASEPITTPEPAPQEPSATAAAADDDDDQEDQPQRSETVSFDRFHRTNERRKEAERAAREESEKRIRLEERLAALLEVQQSAAPKVEQKPNPEDVIPDENDPVAVINWARKQLLAQKERQAQEEWQRETQTREQQQWQEVVTAVQADYERAKVADPTIVEAHNAWRQSMGEELLALGYSQAQAVQQLNQLENDHVRYVHANKISIADHIKKMAAIRGWAANKVAAAPQDAIAEVNKREEARQASLSLGKSGGTAAEIGKVTPQQLAEMNDADFAAYKEKYGSVVHAFQ